MPDYDLGRAHGKVTITADTQGATRGLGEYEKATQKATEATKEHSKVEAELGQRRREAETAIGRRKQAEYEYSRVIKDSTTTAEQHIEAELRRNNARDEAERSTRRLLQAERAYQESVRGNTDAVRKFIATLDNTGVAHDRATRKMREFRNEINQTNRTIEILSRTLSSTLGTALKGAAIGGGIGIAGGAAGLLGAGGVQGIMVAAEAIKDFSGAALLLPAAVGGAVTVMGTLAAAFHGVGEAIKGMDDPQKFKDALDKLSPAAQQAMVTIASFRDAMRGAMAEIQQSFFQPFVNQIQPIIITWLPALMRAGQAVGAVLGQMGSAVGSWLQSTQAMQGFSQFINNLTNGLRGLMPAITPVLNAFTTLNVVGSSFFPQLAEIIVRIANAFNSWVQGAAQSGDLQRWIQTSITSFEQLFHSIGNVISAVGNIFKAFDQSGSKGMLDWLVQITNQFKEWTASVEGANMMVEFFKTMHEASVVLGPILKIIGEAFLQLLTNLAKLGTVMGPGITSFFESLKSALNSLGQSLISAGPGLSQIIESLGKALLEIVQRVGPSLPNLFQTLAKTIIDMTPAVVALAGGLADVMSHITPTHIEVIAGLVAALKMFNVVIPIIQSVSAALTFLAANPVALAIAALAALAIGIIYAYNHSETFRNTVKSLWEDLKNIGSWIASTFVSIWQTLGDAIKNSFQALSTLGSDMSDALTSAWNTVSGLVSGWFTNAYDWGSTLVSRMIDGIKAMFQPLSDAWDWLIGKGIDDKNLHSPAKKGPLSGRGDPFQAGQRVTQTFASGMESGSTGVSNAYDKALGGGTSFATSGISASDTGLRGSRGAQSGQSGFDQYVSMITGDMKQWSDLVQHSFSLFTNVANTIMTTTKVVASLWNQGDNPMTRPGGFFNKYPGPSAEQQMIPGVSNLPSQKGVAPLPNLVPKPPKNALPVPQQGIPGVPQGPGSQPLNQQPKPLPGDVGGPVGPGSTGVPPPPSMPAPAGPGDNALVSALKAQGFSPQQIRLIQGFSQVEGNNPAGNPTLGFTDAQLGGATDLQSHVNALAKQFKDRAGVAGAFPQGGTDQEQAQWIAKVVGQEGLPSDWQGNAQPKDYVQRVIGAMQGIPVGPGGAPAGQAVPPGGAVLGQQRPGVQEGAQGLTPAAQNLSGILQRLFPQLQTIGGVRPDSMEYHPSGTALDVMIPGQTDDLNRPTTPEGLAFGNQIWDFLVANADALGINMDYSLWQQKDHYNHIHAQLKGWPSSGIAPPTNFETNIRNLKNLPPGFLESLPPSAPASPTGAGVGLPGTVPQLPSRPRALGPSPLAGNLPAVLGGGAGALFGLNILRRWANGGVAEPGDAAGARGGLVDLGLFGRQGTQPVFTAEEARARLGVTGDFGLPKPAAIDPVLAAQRNIAQIMTRQLALPPGKAIAPPYRQQLALPPGRSAGLPRPAPGLPVELGIPDVPSLYRGDPVAMMVERLRSQGRLPADLMGGPASLPAIDPNIPLAEQVRRGLITPLEAARINPQEMLDIYHATTDENASRILSGGFQRGAGAGAIDLRASGGLPDAYFATTPESAILNSERYGLPRILRGQIPAMMVRPDDYIGPQGAYRTAYSNLRGVPFSEVTPQELLSPRVPVLPRAPFQIPQGGQVVGGPGVRPFTPSIPGDGGLPIQRPIIPSAPASVVGEVPPSIPGAARGALGRMGFGPVSGPMSLLNAAGITAGIVGEAQRQGQERLQQQGTIATRRDGTVTGPFQDPTFGAPAYHPSDPMAGVPAQPFQPQQSFGSWLGSMAQGGATLGLAVNPLTAPLAIASNILGGQKPPQPPPGFYDQPQRPAPSFVPSAGSPIPTVQNVPIATPPVGQAVPVPKGGFKDTGSFVEAVQKSRMSQGLNPVTGEKAFGSTIIGSAQPQPQAAPVPPAVIQPPQQVPRQIPVRPLGTPTPTTTPTTTPSGAAWNVVPPGWDISQPIPNDVRRTHGIPDSVPPMFYSAQPGSVTNVPAPPGYAGPMPVTPGGTMTVPMPGPQAGFPQSRATVTPFGSQADTFAFGINAIGSLAGDAFQIFNDVITNIKATADITKSLARGIANTEDINKLIDNFQTFIKTGTDIAKTVGDVGGVVSAVGGATGSADFGGTAAAGAAIQAIAGIAQSALEATNQAIDLGQEAWKLVSKYGAIMVGTMLGGPNGALGGNVRMLLNTNTGQLQAYSEDNSQLKTTHNLPQWLSRSYGGPNPNAQPNVRNSQVNIYAGPGQTPRSMMDESMWLVSSGSASVVSVAGQD